MLSSRFLKPKRLSAQYGGYSCLYWSGGYSAGDEEQAQNELASIAVIRHQSTKKLGLALVGMLVICVGTWINWPYLPLPPEVKVDLVVVRKSDRLLELYRGSEAMTGH